MVLGKQRLAGDERDNRDNRNTGNTRNNEKDRGA
jgi:hypothetical protein